jgi:hypothetical protein
LPYLAPPDVFDIGIIAIPLPEFHENIGTIGRASPANFGTAGLYVASDEEIPIEPVAV